MKTVILALALAAVAFPAMADVRSNLRDLDNVMKGMAKEFLNAPNDGALQFDPVSPKKPGAKVKPLRPGSADERQRIENSIRKLEALSRER